MSPADLPDPRTWPAAGAASAGALALHRIVNAAIDASTRQAAEGLDAQARRIVAQWIAADASALAEAFATAPSVHVARHLHRLLAEVEHGDPQRSPALRATLCALPVIVVAAQNAREGDVTLPAVLADPGALASALRDADAFGGARTFAFSPALVAASAIDHEALPGLLARGALDASREDAALQPLDLAPAPIRVAGATEGVHLRFVVGAVLTAPGTDPLRDTCFVRWATPVARALSRQIGAPGVTLLALPRPIARLVPASSATRTIAA